MYVSFDGTAWTSTQDLRERASFELNCPQENLQLTVLSIEGRQLGVSGCGARGTYVYKHLDIAHWGWVNNGIVSTGPQSQVP